MATIINDVHCNDVTSV